MKTLIKIFCIICFIAIIPMAIVIFNLHSNYKGNKAITNAILNESKKRLKELNEVVKMDSIALYDQKNEFIEHINNLQQLRNHDRNEFKRKLSQLKLVTNADYISRNDSLYKYLQGSR